MNPKQPYLRAFLSGYFHQDWPLEAENAKRVVGNYMEREPRASTVAALHEIEELLGAVSDDSVLRRYIRDDLGSFYDPEGDRGLTTREWLQEIRLQMAHWLHQSRDE
jgi:hypothetical protein